MAVKSQNDLSDNARALWLKSLSAMELRNYGYAVSLLQTVLKEAPDFLDGRRMLRKAEIASTKGKKSFLSGLSSASLKGATTLKKDPLAAMELAEKTLESDPYNSAANMLLRDAAVAAGFPEVAAFALETVVEGNPKDTKALHELGAYYYENGAADKAIEIYNRIVAINPADLIAIKRGKDAAARSTMSQGGWEEVASSGGTKDYRDLIKNKDEAISLEQKGRVVKSDDMIERQLGELHAELEKTPGSVDLPRRIAMLYEDKGDLANARDWYAYTSELTKHTDPNITRKVSDIGLKIIDNSIKEFEQWLEQYSDAENADDVRKQLEDLRKQKDDVLLDEARKRVERNPTDLFYRYELGEQLLRSGQPRDAIPELQRARQNPSVRLKAMNLLGQCYVAMNMNDFAVRTFSDTIKEMQIMDDTKKDVLYRLGAIYEKSGDKEKSLDCFKQIYEVDYGYKDVAKRVEESYTPTA